MSVLQAEIDTHNRLRRTLTPVQMIGIGLGGIIGTGIFVSSGHAAANYAGPSIIISFVLAGIAAILSTFSMIEMSVIMSSSGSVYTYAYVALGEYAAFMIGWSSILYYQLSAWIVVVGWSQYVVHFIDLISDYNVTNRIIQAPIAWSGESKSFFSTGGAINIPSMVITIAITIILLIGIRETANINLVFVIMKVIILLIFICAGCAFVDRKHFEPFIPPNQNSFNKYGVTGMLHASTVVFLAYVGFETVIIVAQETKKPARTLPIALILPLIISLLLYIGVSTVMVGLIPYSELNTAYPLLHAAKKTWLAILLALGAIASLTTVAITILLAQSRILYAISHDGLLPPIFSQVHRRTKTPWVSIVVSGGICTIIAGFGPINIFRETVSVAALITYIFVHFSFIIMRYTHGDIPRSFQVPLGPWLVPGVGIILCIILLINTNDVAAMEFSIWIGIGHIVYFVYGFRHSKRRSRLQYGLCATDLELVSSPTETITSETVKTNVAMVEAGEMKKSDPEIV